MHRVGVGQRVRDERVATLVVGDHALLAARRSPGSGARARPSRGRSPPRAGAGRSSSRSCRADSSAASFTRLARSAPVKPGVRRAITSRSTPGASGLPLRVHREDRLAALEVGAVDDDLAVEAAGPQQRRVEDVGPVRRRRAGSRRCVWSKPSISTSSWLSVCSRSSWPPPSAGAAVAADRVDLVDEDDRRRGRLRLLEQVAHAATRRRRRTSRRSRSR